MHIEFSVNGWRQVSRTGRRCFVAALMVSVLVPASSSFAQEKPAKTLFQRMGGYEVIAGIVDDFIGQLRNDPAFARFGGGRSMDSLQRTRQLVVDQLCSLTGGPCNYIGRDMKTAHAGLKITEAEWDSSIKKFQASLDKFKIEQGEQKEFLALIQKTKPDIVEPPKEEKPKGQN